MENTNLVVVNEADISPDGGDISNIPEKKEDSIIELFDTKLIRIEPRFGSINKLLNMLIDDEIDLKNYFQRQDNIWNNKNQSRFI